MRFWRGRFQSRFYTACWSDSQDLAVARVRLSFTVDTIEGEPVRGENGGLWRTYTAGKKRAYFYGVRVPWRVGKWLRRFA